MPEGKIRTISLFLLMIYEILRDRSPLGFYNQSCKNKKTPQGMPGEQKEKASSTTKVVSTTLVVGYFSPDL